MGKQIAFFKKNKADFADTAVLMTASEGNLYAPFVQRRSNNIGWMTTGSVDASNTTLTCDFSNLQTLTDIILVNHNFKSFTVKYWDGSTYQDFSPAVNETTNVDSTSRFSFATIDTTKIQVRITGTQIANSEKRLTQLIATELIGQLAAWALIKKPTHNRNKRDSTMLSGKHFIGENVGGFSVDLSVSYLTFDTDLTLMETLYGSGNGFLVWLCGGDEAQFRTKRIGYRLQDLYLMKCKNDYIPEWYASVYTTGVNITVQLVEVTN